MDRIIFGDNQFFGVNHMSEVRGMEQARRFQDLSAIIQVIDAAYDCGIYFFTFSTHDRVSAICDHFRANPGRYEHLKLYATIPYAHKYANAVAEKGVVGALKDFVVNSNGAGGAARMLLRGGSILLNRDPVAIMKLLVDAELGMFRNLNVQVVFLQNIITDLLLGMKTGAMFQAFARHIQEQHGARPGFITLNMPRLVATLREAEIQDAVVCSAINKIGFQMHPGVEAYEETLATSPYTTVAMSPMAAGALRPVEAMEWLARHPRIDAVMFGASSKAHIQETKALIDRTWSRTDTRALSAASR